MTARLQGDSTQSGRLLVMSGSEPGGSGMAQYGMRRRGGMQKLRQRRGGGGAVWQQYTSILAAR